MMIDEVKGGENCFSFILYSADFHQKREKKFSWSTTTTTSRGPEDKDDTNYLCKNDFTSRLGLLIVAFDNKAAAQVHAH